LFVLQEAVNHASSFLGSMKVCVFLVKIGEKFLQQRINIKF